MRSRRCEDLEENLKMTDAVLGIDVSKNSSFDTNLKGLAQRRAPRASPIQPAGRIT